VAGKSNFVIVYCI